MLINQRTSCAIDHLPFWKINLWRRSQCARTEMAMETLCDLTRRCNTFSGPNKKNNRNEINVYKSVTYLFECRRHGTPYPNDGSWPTMVVLSRRDDCAVAFGVPAGHWCPSSLPYILFIYYNWCTREIIFIFLFVFYICLIFYWLVFVFVSQLIVFLFDHLEVYHTYNALSLSLHVFVWL